jgi:hypothetical protein
MQWRHREGATPPVFFCRKAGMNAKRILNYLLLRLLTTSCIYAKQAVRPAKRVPGVSKRRLRALFDIVNMWLRRARQREPQPVWCDPPSSQDEGGGRARAHPGTKRAKMHFGQTNPRCGNATCLARRVHSNCRSLYFPCYLLGRAASRCRCSHGVHICSLPFDPFGAGIEVTPVPRMGDFAAG